jgi:hypothetical protein
MNRINQETLFEDLKEYENLKKFNLNPNIIFKNPNSYNYIKIK